MQIFPAAGVDLNYAPSWSGNVTYGCKTAGAYCGNDGLDKDANTLYYCSGADLEPTIRSSCTFCVTMPKGQNDQCSTSGSCSNVNTGYYCGSDKVSEY